MSDPSASASLARNEKLTQSLMHPPLIANDLLPALPVLVHSWSSNRLGSRKPITLMIATSQSLHHPREYDFNNNEVDYRSGARCYM